MPIYVYELSNGTTESIARLEQQIPGTITSLNAGNPAIITIDTLASNKDDLDGTMAFLGFESMASEASVVLDSRHDFGRFTTANEPTVNVEEGDTGFDTTLGAFVFYTGATWERVSPFPPALGSFNVVNNATATTISAINTWTNLNLNASAAASLNNNLWTVTNTTTGEIRYDGTPTITVGIMASISGFSLAGQDTYQFRALLNGAITTDNTLMEFTTNTALRNGVLIDAVTVSTNDLIRYQTQNTSASDNITISQLMSVIR